VRVLFTLSQASVLFIDGIRSKLCNNDGVNLRAASQLQSDMELWKDGYYALQLHARWDTPNFPTAYPAINLRLNAGSYWVEYRIADPSELLFNASLTSPPAANAKVFAKHPNANLAMVAIQGLDTTDAWLAYDPYGGNGPPAWTHNNTPTTLRAVNYGDQPVGCLSTLETLPPRTEPCWHPLDGVMMIREGHIGDTFLARRLFLPRRLPVRKLTLI